MVESLTEVTEGMSNTDLPLIDHLKEDRNGDSSMETGSRMSNTDLPLKDHLEKERNGDGGMKESNTDSPPN